VAGIGASAGGLEALSKLFDALPADTGMAFVLIQHLDPTHESLMANLLASHTSMPVRQVIEGITIEPNHVYLIPPGRSLAIEAGMLRLSNPVERHGARMPFDYFLRSLAQDRGARAICVVLSGTGTDGAVGLQAVREQGGMVIVQDPKEAAFDGMPLSAIATGGVDMVLPVAGIAAALVEHGRRTLDTADGAYPGTKAKDTEPFAEIIDLLAATTANDFSAYKPGTLHRRIERRIALSSHSDSATYLRTLRVSAPERKLLAADLLINVTRFFRDTAAFAELDTKVIPELVQGHALDRPIRVWVPGCSTGEEAYSIAMLLLEHIAAAKRTIRLQVFASDIDADCISVARAGFYPKSIAADVTAERLERFFTKEDKGYQVVRDLREAVIFTSQSVLADAPFSRLDLVSCRNLLIYLSPQAQEKVLSLFHFALREGGILFLGSAEAVGNVSSRFSPISKKHRIYRHLAVSRPGEVQFPLGAGSAPAPPVKGAPPHPAPRRPSVAELSQRALLEAYAPASVLVNARHECLFHFGPVDRYLKIASGETTRDVFAMAREGLRAKLRSALLRAKETQAPVLVSSTQMDRDGGQAQVGIAVRPLAYDGEGAYLISFVDEASPKRTLPQTTGTDADAPRIAQLEQDLEASREDLQSAVADLEMANEEQKAVNEEAMSVNEEYQSTNEELETSKEELQSLNEELSALNGQLHETVEQQRATSSDLQNILASTDMATLFLDAALNIRFFTPAAKSLFNVIDSDVGRPLADLNRRFEDAALLNDARTVLGTGQTLRQEVMGNDGVWYMRGMLPYRSDDRRVGGVVITFSVISEIKAAEQEIEAARAYLGSIIATIQQPLVVLDDDLRVVSISGSFRRVFSVESKDLIGKPLLAAADHLNVPSLGEFLTSIKATGTSVTDHEVAIELPGAGRRTFLMNARILHEAPSATRKILIAIADVTDARREGHALEAAKSQAERANAGKSRFLAAASHDLRQPLQTISLLQGLLERHAQDEPAKKLLSRLDETVTTMSSMLDKLLDINQLEAGVVQPVVRDFPVSQLLDEMRADFAHSAESHGLDLRVVPSGLLVRSDPRLLEQIVRNLLSNAMKYTAKGRVLFGCRRCGGKVSIEVWDTGAGIPQAELGAIFDEFHQLSNPARQRSKGLGLGLAIVQRLADLLGHKINVRSRVDAGSMFSIEVPFGALSEPDSQHLVHRIVPPSKTKASTVLIVDDDPSVREMLQMLFDAEDHRTIVAADGTAAIELAAQEACEPDLVVADYNLPAGPNGLELIAKLRSRFKREIPAIVLTGDISTNSLRDIGQSTCLHLNKPVKAAELIRVAASLLATSQRQITSDAANSALEPAADRASTIFVVDDDAALRETMCELLRQRGFAVQPFTDGAAFLSGYSPGQRGCLLVDAIMPGVSGIEVVARLKQDGIDLPAIVITGNGAVSMAVQAMKAGAVDFIEKPVRYHELLAAIAGAIEASLLVGGAKASQTAATARISSLTSRQRQILDLVLAGHPSKNIAADLGISQRTVDNHRAAIMRKTGSKSVPALVRTALAAV